MLFCNEMHCELVFKTFCNWGPQPEAINLRVLPWYEKVWEPFAVTVTAVQFVYATDSPEVQQ